MLYGKHTRTWLNAYGAQWRNEVQVGYETLFKTSLYQPLDISQRFFVEPGAVLSLSLRTFRDGDRIASYHFADIG